MVRVQLGASLATAVGDRTEFNVDAGNVMQLLASLRKHYPELGAILERGVAVAIDGQIYNNSWLQPIPPNAEVFLMPKMSAG